MYLRFIAICIVFTVCGQSKQLLDHIRNQKVEPVVAHIRKNKNPNPIISDKATNTLLHAAAQYNATEIAREIIDIATRQQDVGPPVYAINNAEQTPLHVAVKEGNVDMVQLLLRYGADPNFLDANGNTPLHVAVQKSKDDALLFLLDHDLANPNTQNNKQQTPLHIAVARSSEENVRKLLDHPDIDPNITDAKGKTPVEIAIELQQKTESPAIDDIIRLINNHPMTVTDKSEIDKQLQLLYDHVNALYTAVL